MKVDVDYKQTYEWLQRVKEGVEDARPLWKAITPQIREWAGNEFAGGNPNRWMKLTPKYKNWKAKKGFPTKIGTMTGTLGKAASTGALVDYKKDEMEFIVDSSKTLTKKGDSYAKYFNKARPIYKWTSSRVVPWLKGITMKHLNSLIRKSK